MSGRENSAKNERCHTLFLIRLSEKLSELTLLKWVLFPLILEREVGVWSINDHDCKMKERLLEKKINF